MDQYLPIAEHGIIGDLHTVALIGSDGTIDWYCCPNFDSPSVFGAILDRERGGYYRISPTTDEWAPKQLYFPETNVLITRFLSPDGVGELQGFMPIPRDGEERHRHRLARRVLCVRGEMRFRLDLKPRFNYGRDEHTVEHYGHGVIFRSPNLCLALQGTKPIACDDIDAHSEFTLKAGETVTFVLESVDPDYTPRAYRRTRRARRTSARSRTGAAGCRSPATAGAGGSRWSARRSSSSSSRSTRPARLWPRRRRVSRSRSGAGAIGTIATPGSGTPPSRSTGSFASVSLKRRLRFWDC